MLQPGRYVSIRGLKSRSELNGRHGVVRQYTASSGRYAVDVEGEAKALALKRANLAYFVPPPEELTDPEALVEAGARLALGSLLPGDFVLSQAGHKGTLVSVTDRMATIACCRQETEQEEEEEEEECLLRDCTMLCPTGRERAAPAVVRQSFELGFWAETWAADASGQWSDGQGRRGSGGLEREGVHWLLPVGTSRPVPPCVRVASVALELDGMDQGWGNSGDSGVLLSLKRRGPQGGELEDEEGEAAAAAAAAAAAPRARAGHNAASDEREPVLEIVFDRSRRERRGPHHVAALELTPGPFAPVAGDRFEIFLRCPSYPGWSAHCKRVRVAVTCDVHDADAVGLPMTTWALPAGWDSQAHATAAFLALWDTLSAGLPPLSASSSSASSASSASSSEPGAALSSGAAAAAARIVVDPSHIALEGLRRQGVWQQPAETPAAAENAGSRAGSANGAPTAASAAILPERLQAAMAALDLPASVVEGAMKLMKRLAHDAAQDGSAASRQAAARARRCAAVAHATLNALEPTRPGGGAQGAVGSSEVAANGGSDASEGLLPIVCMHWAEAQEHCAYRWEREMEMMLDLTAGRTRCSGAAAHIEDLLLRLLLDERRQWAEQALHAAKGSTRTDDMHFESYFYSEVSFGLPEQVHARRDPNRLTYAQHGLADFDASQVTTSLRDRYTPAAVCEIVRRKVLDSTEPAAAELREKLVDWLGAHIPAGMLPGSPMAERRSTWLHTYCHDEQYRMTEPALLFALCGMNILHLDWPSAARAIAGPAVGPAATRTDGRGGGGGIREVEPTRGVVGGVAGGAQQPAEHLADVQAAPPRAGSSGWVLAGWVLLVAIVPSLLLRVRSLLVLPSFEGWG